MICFDFTDRLGHGAHGAVHAPGAGLAQHHRNKAQQRGSQHHAVESEGELGNAGGKQRPVVGPVPGQTEGPQLGNHLGKFLDSGKYQVGIPQHDPKHGEEKDQKAIPEPA